MFSLVSVGSKAVASNAGSSFLQDAGNYASIAAAITAVLLIFVAIWVWCLKRRRQSSLSEFLNEGNELLVRLHKAAWGDPSFPPLAIEMSAWFERVENSVPRRFRATLRSDAGLVRLDESNADGEYKYFLSWLPQRLTQIDKVQSQL